MIVCPKCQKQLENNAKFCEHCGEKIGKDTQENQSYKEPQYSDDLNFFTKLRTGYYGLAKTFWLYGILVRIILNTIFILLKSFLFIPFFLIIVFSLIYVSYELILMLGIWASANQYKGFSLWSILAKVFVVLGFIALLGNISKFINTIN